MVTVKELCLSNNKSSIFNPMWAWYLIICRHLRNCVNLKYINDNSNLFSFHKLSVNLFLMLMLTLCVCWSVAPPSAHQPIKKPGAFRLPGCQLPLSLRYDRFKSQKSDVKPIGLCYNSQQHHDRAKNKTRVRVGNAFERWKNNLKTDADVANVFLDR